MALNKLLWYAESACAFVDGFSIKASNRSENAQGRAFTPDLKALRQVMRGPEIAQDGVGKARARANLCMQRRVGNCAEQTSMAFIYLLDKYGASCNGLAMVETKTYDHVFLVVGLPIARRAAATYINARITTPPDDWDMNAVICDPWYHEWYEVNEFKAKMRQTLLKSANIGMIRPGADLGFMYLARA